MEVDSEGSLHSRALNIMLHQVENPFQLSGEVVITLILEHLDAFDILAMRKVSI